MGSDDEKQKEGSFQVVDKRRFDASGQERSEETPRPVAGPTESQSETARVKAEFTMSEGAAGSDEEPIAFSSFIMSLATQTLVQIGEMPPPQGMEIPVDMESARQTIDILAMLRKRTRGNLSQEENRLFEEVLHSLRASYVMKSKK